MTEQSAWARPLRILVPGVAVAILYFLLAQMGFWLAIAPGNVSPFWPAAGVAAGAIYLFGPWVAPGIWIGSFAANAVFMQGAVPPTTTALAAAGIATGSTVQGLVLIFLLRRGIGQFPAAPQPRTFARFAGIAALTSTIGATFGVTSLLWSGLAGTEQIAPIWLTWWQGDLLGTLVVLPVLIVGNLLWQGQAANRQVTAAAAGLGTGLTILVFLILWRQEAAYAGAIFASDAKVTVDTIQRSVNLATHNLEALEGLYASSDGVERDEFMSYVEMHQHKFDSPGIVGLAWAPRVPAAERSRFEGAAHRDGLSGFRITEPDGQGNLVEAGARPTYFPVYFAALTEGITQTLGLDLGAEPETGAALAAAAETGNSVFTSAQLPWPSSGGVELAYSFHPVYEQGAPVATSEARRAALLGYLVGVFRIDELVDASLSIIPGQGLEVYVLDENAPLAQQLRYAPPSPGTNSRAVDARQALASLRAGEYFEGLLDMDGYPWRVIVKRALGWTDSQRSLFPWLALGTGLLLTGFSVAYLNKRGETEAMIRDSQRQYQLLAENVSDVIWILDVESGRFRYISPSVERLRGLTPEAVEHERIEDTITPASQRYLAALTPARRSAFGAGIVEVYVDEIEQWRHDGTTVMTETTTRYVNNTDTGRLEIYGVSRDITARKEAEAELIAERASLARRVEERTVDLTRANAELAHALRTKDEFLANMSHELRTPLTAILGLSESLMEMTRGPLNDSQLAAIGMIEQSGRHLLSLISDILDLAKVEAGKLEIYPEPVDVRGLCRASIQFVQEAARKKNVQVSLETDLLATGVTADPKRLKQILVNLLSNAVKFTPPGGAVNLAVTADPANAAIRFAVSDDGIGIAPADIERLFKPFVQLDAGLARQYEGTGLGLALVHQLVELHGGAIHVASDGIPGHGSCFTVTLPWRLAADDADGDLALPGQAPQSPAAGWVATTPAQLEGSCATILIADDNAINTTSVSDYLTAHGYRVLTASNGQEALAAAHQFDPDVILMDIQMPIMDGLTAIRLLRGEPRFARTPILALTALTMPGDAERCRAAGADDYIAKPMSLRELLAKIGKYIQRSTGE